MDQQYIVDSLHLRNFRCLADFRLEFNTGTRRVRRGDALLEVGPLTVVVARNGLGKTSVLDGLRIIFGTYTTCFDYRSPASFTPRDLRQHPDGEGGIVMSPYVLAEAVLHWDGVRREVARELRGERGRTTVRDVRALTELGRALKERRLQGQVVQWPVLAYYGTGRFWGEHRDHDSQRYLVRRDDYGYEGCLAVRPGFKAVGGWLRDAVLEGLVSACDGVRPSRGIGLQRQTIMQALDAVLSQEGYDHGLRLDPFDKSLAIRQGGVTIPVDRLSDGVAAVFGLVADLAFRCVKLNRHLGADAVRLARGLVMIDEVDLHLHPSWQQRILDDLQAVFPGLQFVVTTHSPQVISSVPRECVRVIDAGRAAESASPTQGREPGELLAEIFGTDPIPLNSEIIHKLHRLQALAAEGADDALWQPLLAELEDYYGPGYPALQGARDHRDFIRSRKQTRCTDCIGQSRNLPN